MGNLIEQFNRTFKFDSILGGSEEYVHQLDAATTGLARAQLMRVLLQSIIGSIRPSGSQEDVQSWLVLFLLMNACTTWFGGAANALTFSAL